MECKIEKLTPFTTKFEEDKEHNAVAAVTVEIGPVRVQTRLWHSEKDQRWWLQMPGRRLENQDNKWFDYIRWTDTKVLEAVRDQAVEMYKAAMN